MTRTSLMGAGLAIGGAFPLAALVALAYGFPVPFAGKMSGVGAVIPSQFAVVMYGMIGGFLVLGLGGAAAGAVAFKLGTADSRKITWLCTTLSLAFSAACVVLLAMLDLIIGPW